jgi:small conductance mechanosensitive channel
MESFTTTAQELVVNYGPRLVAAIVILIIGRLLAKVLVGLVAKAMQRAGVDSMLISFLRNILYVGAMAFVIMAVLGQIGIQTTSFIAVLGAAGLAIGLALQGSLSNFAAGVMLVLFRPFKVGDYIEAAGTAGVVEEMLIFSTRLRTGDNREIFVPNGAIVNGNITNFSAKSTRRVDLVFGVSYDDDIKHVKRVIDEVLAADTRILSDPAPTVGVSELADNSVNFIVRPWVNAADHWGVRLGLTEAMKLRFDAEGISIPYPQRDVHLHQKSAA